MLKMKKVLTLLVAVAMLASLFAACGQNAQETTAATTQATTAAGETTEPTTAAPEPVTIDYWHIFPDGDPYKAYFTGLVDEFEKQNSYITVKELGVSFWDYWGKVTTAVAAGTPPDVYFNGIADVPTRAKAGTIVKMDDFIAKYGFKTEEIYANALEACKYNGSIYAMPFDMDVRILYYNKAHFRDAGLDPEKPPVTWDEVEQYADKLTKMKGNLIEQAGFVPPYSTSVGNFNYVTLAWTFGADLMKDGKPVVNTPEAKEALEWNKKMMEKYGKKSMMGFITSNSAGNDKDPFIMGKVSMYVTNEGLYSQIKQYNPSLEFGTAVLPYKKVQTSFSSGFSLEIGDNKDANRADAAWKLVSYFMSKEVQKDFNKNVGWSMCNMLAMDDPEITADPVWKTVGEQMKTSKMVEFVEACPRWGDLINPEVLAYIDGTKNADEALATAQKAIEDAIATYGNQ